MPDYMDVAIRSLTEGTGFIPEGTSHIFSAMIEAFPSEEFEALFVTDNSARKIMN